jgi:hypothetical protein
VPDSAERRVDDSRLADGGGGGDAGGRHDIKDSVGLLVGV